MYSVFIRYNTSQDGDIWSENIVDAYLGSFSARVTAEEAAKTVNLEKYETCLRRCYGADLIGNTFAFVFEHEMDKLLNLEDVSTMSDRVSREKKAAWKTGPEGVAYVARIEKEALEYQEISDTIRVANEQIRAANLKKKAMEDAAKCERYANK
jgi:hypothetical protein